MPRIPRRKAVLNNNNVGEEHLASKRRRVVFELPLPQRSNKLGMALVCGIGDMGQLGLGDDQNKLERKRPALLESVHNVVDVCAGGMHNLVLTNEGILYSFGCNDEGALGRETTDEGSEFEPKKVELPGKVTKISAGDSHSACLLEDGRVFAWGSFRDSHGNMGLTLEGNKRLPIDLLPGTVCTDIASGADHLVVLTCFGKVFTIGCGEQGQLGRVSMRSASGEGRRGKTELLSPAQVQINRGKPIDAIWTTNYCTFVREADTQNIWVFGLNNYKQLMFDKNVDTVGRPITIGLKNVLQIAGGQHHTLVLTSDGSCYAIGRADYGRLGLGKIEADIQELKKINSFDDKNIVSVSCGESTSFAISADGKLFSWGMGTNHQLGTGTDDDVLEPKQIISKQTEDKKIIRASSGGQHSIFLVEHKPVQAKEPALKDQGRKPALTKKAAAAAAAKEKEAKAMAENIIDTTLDSIDALITNQSVQDKTSNQPKDGKILNPSEGNDTPSDDTEAFVSDVSSATNRKRNLDTQPAKMAAKRGRKRK